MKPAVLAGAALLMLPGASVAHAENWVYWAIPGGALAYDDDSRKIDVASGMVAADVLTFYFVPQAVGPDAYNIRSERLAFNCRGQQFRTLASGLFSDEAPLRVRTEPTEWAAIPPTSPPAVFQRVFCSNARPPVAKEAKSQPALRAALHALPLTGQRPADPPRPAATPPAKPSGLLSAPAPSLAPKP